MGSPNERFEATSHGIWSWWQHNPSLNLAHLQEDLLDRKIEVWFIACKEEKAKKCGASFLTPDGKDCSYALFVTNNKKEAITKLKEEGISNEENKERLRDCGMPHHDNFDLFKKKMRSLYGTKVKENYTCAWCTKALPHPLRCITCKRIFYCDKKCQKLDWKKHKRECKT